MHLLKQPLRWIRNDPEKIKWNGFNHGHSFMVLVTYVYWAVINFASSSCKSSLQYLCINGVGPVCPWKRNLFINRLNIRPSLRVRREQILEGRGGGKGGRERERSLPLLFSLSTCLFPFPTETPDTRAKCWLRGGVGWQSSGSALLSANLSQRAFAYSWFSIS